MKSKTHEQCGAICGPAPTGDETAGGGNAFYVCVIAANLPLFALEG